MGFFSRNKKGGFFGKKETKEKPKPQPVKVEPKKLPPPEESENEGDEVRILTAEGFRRQMKRKAKS